MPNWKKVILSGSNAHINNITASGHVSALNDSFTVNDHTSTELFVEGNITASNLQILETASITYFETTYQSSSIIFSSGSTKFGDTLDDTHTFTGSLFITGISYDSTPQPAAAVLTIDTASGRLYYTGSYGGGGGGDGVGFPYSGSDSLTNNPSIAVITGSLLLSGSGHISASNGDIRAKKFFTEGGLQLTGVEIANTSDTNVAIDLTSAGLSFKANSGDKFKFNEDLNNTDFEIFGEDTTPIFYVDASQNNVGIGTTGPFQGPKLDVNGGVRLHNITSSGDISGSGALFASLSFNEFDGAAINLRTVVYEPPEAGGSGKFFYTSAFSEGGGGTGNTGSLLETASASGNTITFTQGDGTTFNIDVNPTLQEVTDAGNTTTEGSTFHSGQNYSWGAGPSAAANSGFIVDGGNALSKVTPQISPGGFRWFPVGNIGSTVSPGRLAPSPSNYLVYNSNWYVIGNGPVPPPDDGVGGGNGGTNEDGSVGGLIIEGGGIQLKSTSSGDGIGGISLVPGNGNPSIFFFESASGTVVPSGSLNQFSASAKIGINTGSHAIEFFAGSVNEDLVKVLHVSKSGVNPRVGIGTDDPKGVFDFKDIGDTTTGAELLLRSARSSIGAQVGDEGGTINFTIDSSSFNNIKNTGSLAKIKTKVTSIATGGAQGKLTFELSKGSVVSVDAFEYGFNIGGQALFASVQTASLVMKDFSSGGESIFQMRDFDDNVRFEVNDGLLYASGNISSSGDVIANTINGNINGGSF